MIYIPYYLRYIAYCVQHRNKSVTFHINCSCKNTKFILFKSLVGEQEQEKIKKWEELLKKYNGGGYSDEKGNVFLKTKGFSCFVSKIMVEKSMIPHYNKGIKIKCTECGKEYTIFDSRINGYDAVTNLKTENVISLNPLDYEVLKFNANNDPVKVTVKLINDLSYDEFIDQVGEEFCEDDYLNAFSSIDIYAESDNKKRSVFSMETA